MTTVTVDVDIDLDDIETDDLIEELESRGEEIPNPYTAGMVRIISMMRDGDIKNAIIAAEEMIYAEHQKTPGEVAEQYKKWVSRGKAPL